MLAVTIACSSTSYGSIWYVLGSAPPATFRGRKVPSFHGVLVDDSSFTAGSLTSFVQAHEVSSYCMREDTRANVFGHGLREDTHSNGSG